MDTTKTVLGTMVLVITLPAFTSYMWAYISEDPTLRPLGITEQDLREFEARTSDEEVPRQVRTNIVYNPEKHKNIEEFASQINAAFGAKSVHNEVTFEETDASDVQVTFQIGASYLGPVGPQDVPNSIVAASEAFKFETN